MPTEGDRSIVMLNWTSLNSFGPISHLGVTVAKASSIAVKSVHKNQNELDSVMIT